MKKRIVFVLMSVVMVFNGALAQNRLVATLKHGDTTKYFYGSSALQLAHDEAESGDIITLSSGVFRTITISKAITVRGAGMKRNSYTNEDATVIEKITFTDGLKNASFAGVDVLNINDNSKSVSDIIFEKCKFEYFAGQNQFILTNWNFIDCVFTFIHMDGEKSVFYKNCAFYDCAVSSDNALGYYENCVVRMTRGGNGGIFLPASMRYNEYKNCILCSNENGEGGTYLPNTATVENCVCIGFVYPDNVQNPETNTHVDDFSAIFKTYTGDEFSDSETFELTEEASTTYLGSDGKQVGLYGGDTPFNTPLSYPQATRVNVGKRAVDGKLSVDIEFNGTE